MPALSRAISAVVSPKISVWSSETLEMIATCGCNTFVPSRRPPIPASITATSTPARCKRDEREREQHFVVRWAAVFARHRFDCRHHVGEQLTERILGDRRPVDADPFGRRNEVRLGMQSDLLAARLEDGSEHRGRRTLTAGAGDVQRGILQLRLAQRRDERTNAVEPIRRSTGSVLVDETEQIGLRAGEVHLRIAST